MSQTGFGLGHTHLPSCDREVSKDAVFLIFMAGVGLQTLRQRDRQSDSRYIQRDGYTRSQTDG